MVEKEMMFMGLKDFYNKSRYIKSLYNELCIDEKRIYKMYVYSNCLLTESQKDRIWEYLNEPFGSIWYVPQDVLKDYSKNARI